MPWSLEILHSLFIHFPIALFSTGFACDLIAYVLRKDSAENAGWWCLLFGLVSHVFAIITGFIADDLYGHFDFDLFNFFNIHGLIQIVIFIPFLLIFLYRFNKNIIKLSKKQSFIYFSVLGFSVILLFYGSHLGALLSGRV